MWLARSRSAATCLSSTTTKNYLRTHDIFKLEGIPLIALVDEKILQEISLENSEVEHDFSGGLS